MTVKLLSELLQSRLRGRGITAGPSGAIFRGTFGTQNRKPMFPQFRRDEIFDAAPTKPVRAGTDSTHAILGTGLQTNSAIESHLLKSHGQFLLLGSKSLIFLVKLELLQNGPLVIIIS
jgi:hypothetical protein